MLQARSKRVAGLATVPSSEYLGIAVLKAQRFGLAGSLAMHPCQTNSGGSTSTRMGGGLDEMLTHLWDIHMAVLVQKGSQLDGATLPPVVLCRLAAHDAGGLLENPAHTLSTCTSSSLLSSHAVLRASAPWQLAGDRNLCRTVEDGIIP